MRIRFLHRLCRIFLAFDLTLLLFTNAVAAGHRKILHTFLDEPAANPGSNLIFDGQGNIYGSTASSGRQACKCGTIFRLSPEAGGQWGYRVLYQFKGKDDGGYPVGSLAFDDADNLYGVSAFGYGSIFKLTQQSDGSWTETTIYTFKGPPDGSTPYSGLTIDKFRSIYGTTREGGVNGLGAVYQLTPMSNGGWSENVIYSFSGQDGEYPWAEVIVDPSGNLYGTTIWGGNYGWGTVFKLTPNGGNWTETVLYSFKAGSAHGLPAAGVYVDSLGNIYGTLSDNGTGYGGAVFRLKLSGDTAGNLYGTTYVGGANGDGTIYKLSHMPSGEWKETVFLSFDYTDGANPANNPVTFDPSGDLFVATGAGGRHAGYDGYGVVLEIAP